MQMADQTVRDVMTSDPATVESSASAVEAAAAMRDNDIGAIVVTDGDQACGIVTDRDIVVRAVADGRDPGELKVEEICTTEVATLSPDDPVERAVAEMRERDVRRLPIVENGRAVGIVSLGDLAIERDSDSVLADISAAPANN
jgi:CBS domain-containing protein